jgi:cyclic dehypoxanthinyl futalosine synthase
MEADSLRRQLHPEGVVTYLLDQTIEINQPIHDDASEAELAGLFAAIAEAAASGCTGIRLRGLPADAKIESLENLLAAVRQRFPQLSLQAWSPQQIAAIANSNQLSIPAVLARLHEAGLDSIAGDEIPIAAQLTDSLAVHHAAHRLGMRTTATMIFGAGESPEQCIDYLDQVRRLQQQTGGFAAFAPRNAQAARGWEEATAVEYLKVIAVSRLYLDNIDNLQAGISTQGLKVLQMGLRFGVNDAGSVAHEANAPTEEDLRRVIRDAGFQPMQRDPLYRTMFLN